MAPLHGFIWTQFLMKLLQHPKGRSREFPNLTGEQQNSILGFKYQRVICGVSLCTISIPRIIFHGSSVIAEE